jgi:hypothetical protein
MNTDWKGFLSDKKKLVCFILLGIAGISFVMMFSKFMIWHETRPGMVINDPILELMKPVNLSRITMPITIIPIFFGMMLIFRKPKTTVYFLFSAILICIFRSLSMLIVPLEAPIGIIPLTDPIVERLFYGGHVLQKDLFFSGHTANLVLIGLLLEDRNLKKTLFFIACIVGFLLIWQRVHYSFDVFAAPFFSYLTFRISVYLGNKIFLEEELQSEVTKTLNPEIKI